MADETYPQELRYFKEHDWVQVAGEDAVFGITWFAQDALGEIVYVELPAVGDEVTAGSPYGELESVKAVTDVYAPLTGEIVEVNASLDDSPETVNSDPHGDGWMIKIRVEDDSEVSSLLSAEEYDAFITEG